jgi:uncharacterized protein (TIGR02996 family)
MSDRQALIESIRFNPDEDTPRLVLADWYEENGDPERGEFIRVQCELARTDPTAERYPELHARQLQLLIEHEREWLGEWADRLVRWEFRRGLLDEVTIQPDPYCADGAALFRDHPVWRVAFLDDQGESLSPPAIRDVLSQPHSRLLRSIDAAACQSGEQAAAMFGGDIHTNAWLSGLARSTTIDGLRGLNLNGGTRGGRESIELDVWKQFCAAGHLRGLTHLDVSNHYDYHGDRAAWQPIFGVLADASFATELRFLEFEGCHVGPEALRLLIRSRRFSQLRSLTVGGHVAHFAFAGVLPALLDPVSLPSLRGLTIPYGSHLQEVVNHPGWNRLKRIGLAGADQHEDRARVTHTPIWRAFFRSPHINPTAFHLNSPGYFDPEEVGLWDELSRAPWFCLLQELTIHFYERNCAPLFEREFAHFPQLRRLALNPNTELVTFLASWPGLANLLELDLNDSYGATKPGATVQLFESTYLTPRLSRLRASGICRSAEAVAALVNCAALKGVTHLDFAFNGLTSQCASALAASPHLRQLKSLHTWSEWQEEEGDEADTHPWLILADPKAFPQLRDVVIGSATNEVVQQELRRRFGPRLRVFSDC